MQSRGIRESVCQPTWKTKSNILQRNFHRSFSLPTFVELDAFLVGEELLKSSQSAAEKMGPQALLQQLQSWSLRKLKTLSTCGRFWLQKKYRTQNCWCLPLRWGSRWRSSRGTPPSPEGIPWWGVELIQQTLRCLRQLTRCRRRSSQGRRPESRAGARVPEHFGLVAICLMLMATEPILRLMDSPASGSCSACLRWREGRRR